MWKFALFNGKLNSIESKLSKKKKLNFRLLFNRQFTFCLEVHDFGGSDD